MGEIRHFHIDGVVHPGDVVAMRELVRGREFFLNGVLYGPDAAPLIEPGDTVAIVAERSAIDRLAELADE